MVDQDAPAGKAGIKEHDVILTMNGTPIESGAQLRRMIHETPAGRVVTLGLSRDGQPLTVKVQLADRHKEFGMNTPKAKDFQFEMPEIHVPEIDIPSIRVMVVTQSARSGLTVENLTPQLGEFFGVKNGNGVLVRSVDKGSRADKAGFRAGDIIVKINGEPVHDSGDFSHAVRSRSGNSVAVDVVRDKKEQTLTLPLSEHRESGDIWEEQSFENEPQMRAQAALELTELQTEIAKMRPELELAAENARKSAEELRKSFCDQQRQFREQARKQKEQASRQFQEFRRQMERMRLDMRRNWADI